MKYIFLLLISINVGGIAAQPSNWFMTDDVAVHIEPDTRLYIAGNAKISGVIHNDGQINFASNVEFQIPSVPGELKFSGRSDQTITGGSIELSKLNIEKENNLHLQLEELRVNELLILNKGFIHTGGSNLVVTSGKIEGGSPDAFIAGRLAQISQGNSLFYPLGIDGLFNSIELSAVPKGSATGITLQSPDLARLIPNDSLTGIADLAEWIINYQGNDTVTLVSINFEGLDLINTPNKNEIRAFRYSPVISTYIDSLDFYRPLGVGSLEDTDSLSFGLITAQKPIELKNGRLTFLGIGRMPLSTGLFFYVPNVFAPNGSDERNRVFRPFLEGVTIQRIRMVVWDSFNQEVYRLDQEEPDMENIGWNGDGARGDLSNQGTYFYSIKISTPTGDFERSGSFVMLL